ncbi:MAG: hypothetical protein WD552_00940 [Candidatus Paceibacterota bacterium]
MQDKELENLNRQLSETRQLAEENRELLGKIYKILWRGRLFHFLYWFVIIGFAIGAFYFLEPYFDQLMNAYGGLQGQFDAFPNFGGSSS